MQPTNNNKETAVEFLKLVIAGKIAEAYEKYTAPNGKHHNGFYPAGFPALQKGMEENEAQFPNKKFDIKHVLEDGDFVAVHSHLTLDPTKHISVVHLFRFENGKIVEMWDCGQHIPDDSPNKDGMF